MAFFAHANLRTRDEGETQNEIGEGFLPETMSSVFPVDDLPESFWVAAALNGPSSLPPAGMSRSQSEWALQRVLEEYAAPGAISAPRGDDNVLNSSSAPSQPSLSRVNKVGSSDDVVEIKKPNSYNRDREPSKSPNRSQDHPSQQPSAANPPLQIDWDEYRALLRSKLDLACAAVALAQASDVKDEGSPPIDYQTQTLGTQDQGSSKAQNETDAAAGAKSAIATVQQKSGILVRQSTSGSSREDSDDDELEGETETTENTDPADVKRARRMLSNRESARRSRRRKQDHLNKLEAQVGQLSVEHSTLLSRLTELNHKCDDTAVDNRILKADIETLRTKVKMAEEMVKRVTGINPLLLSRYNVPNVGMPFVSSPLEAATGGVVPMQPKTNQFYHQPVPNIATDVHHQRVENGYPSNTLVPPLVNHQTDVGSRNAVETSSLQHAAAVPGPMHDQIRLSGVQKQICHGVGTCGALPSWDSGLPSAVANNKQP